jgi:hypothetical protein
MCLALGPLSPNISPAKAGDTNPPCSMNRRKNDAIDTKGEKEQSEGKTEPLN